MERFRERLVRFFEGRYGPDALGRALLVVYLVLLIVNAFVHSFVLSLPEFAVVGVWIWRVLSRNIPARMRENEWYLARTERLRRWGRLQKNRWRDRKTHVYRTCPHCRATVRLPRRQRGRHACDCPRCRGEFRVYIP